MLILTNKSYDTYEIIFKIMPMNRFISEIMFNYNLNHNSSLSLSIVILLHWPTNLQEPKSFPNFMIKHSKNLLFNELHFCSLSSRYINTVMIIQAHNQFVIEKQNQMLEAQIKELMSKYIPSIDGKEIKVHRLSGLTNVTYAVYIDNAPLYVFKVFSDGFDRETENKVVQHLSDLQLSPNVIHAEQIFRIEQFLGNTRHPDQNDFNDLGFLQRTLEHIGNFHQVSFPAVQETLSDYLFSEKQIQELKMYRKSKSPNGNSNAYNTLYDHLETILSDRVSISEQLLPKTKDSLRFCHNDLNNLNILFDKQKMHFIDYDYVGANYLAYDIANFLNESTIDYCTNNYPGFHLIKELTFQQISTISKFYPGYYANLEMDVLKFMCVANLYWAVWSIKRFDLNKSEGFGVAEHGLLRIRLYQHYRGML